MEIRESCRKLYTLTADLYVGIFEYALVTVLRSDFASDKSHFISDKSPRRFQGYILQVQRCKIVELKTMLS